jgi:DNA modification methylase
MSITILLGDSLQVLPTLPANSFDSLVTDPPASISFMGQKWDSDRGGREQWVGWLTQIMKEAFRILKPGAHGLIWAIPRRSHWTALALEDAGFEIRDCLCHYFLTGFPKSLAVDKSIYKLLGAKRKVNGSRKTHDIRDRNLASFKKSMTNEYTASSSPEANEWNGWGTSLKPAVEHWWLVRKPLSERTIAENVMRWGTGALNVGACRIPVHRAKGTSHDDWMNNAGAFAGRPQSKTPFPEGATSAERVSKECKGKPRPTDQYPDSRYPSHFIVSDWDLLGDHTGFFHPPLYCPKPKTKEKNKGLTGMPLIDPDQRTDAGKGHGRGFPNSNRANFHPTVKAVTLMKHFITLLTRPCGSVLDCFAGSFTTGVAAQELGMDFTGIELDASYVKIGVNRLSA